MMKALNKKDFYDDYILDIKAKYDSTKKMIIQKQQDLTVLLNRLYILMSNDDNLFNDMLTIDIHLSKLESICKQYKRMSIYNQWQRIKAKILILEQKLELYNKANISYSDYIKFSDTYNANGVKLLVNGGYFDLGGSAGTLKVLLVKNKNNAKKLDYRASNKYKQHLLDTGKIPYNHEDALKAKAEGKEYHGIDWRIYHYDEEYPYVDWKVALGQAGQYYSFIPSRTDSKTPRDTIINTIENKSDIFNYNMGLVKYIHILKEKYDDYLRTLNN